MNFNEIALYFACSGQSTCTP